jgi:hypothetical protein
MARDELIAAVPIRESQGRLYVRIDDVSVLWREQLATALEGSAFIAVQGDDVHHPVCPRLGCLGPRPVGRPPWADRA